MNHEKLHCYQHLLSMAGQLHATMRRWPSGTAYLADQTKRAMASTLLNLAEGNGKAMQGKERRRFFHIALGSIAEVTACLDLMHEFGLIDSQMQTTLKAGLRKCYNQIRKLP